MDKYEANLKVIVLILGIIISLMVLSLLVGCSAKDMKTVDTIFRTARMIQNNACNGVDGEPSMADMACAVMLPEYCNNVRVYCALADISWPTAMLLADIVNGALEDSHAATTGGDDTR